MRGKQLSGRVMDYAFLALALVTAMLVFTGCSKRGVIRGRVLFPAAPDSAITAEPVDTSATDAVVYVITDELRVPPPKQGRARVTQTDEGFEPHVLPVTLGTEVEFRNRGKVYHNAFSVSPVQKFDLGRYAPGQNRKVTFDRLGIVNVFCELHPATAGFVVVLPAQFYAKPDATGVFTLPNLPKGRYTVKVWHPIFGEISQQVDLLKQGGVDLELEF
jgi:plastocyanin